MSDCIYPEMELAHPGETLHGTGDRDAVDVTSWISVCPKGLYGVQRTQAHEWRQPTVSNAENVAGMMLCKWPLSSPFF